MLRREEPRRTLSLTLLVVATLGVSGCSARSDRLVLPGAVDEPVTLRVDLPESNEPLDWSEVFAVYVDDNTETSSPAGPVQGTYRLLGDKWTFRPDFPFSPGVTYRVDVAADLVAADNLGGVRFSLPTPRSLAPPRVERIFPTSDTLPQNVLRFYLYFSNPMQRGWASRSIRLYEEDGREVESVFMELKQELWSPDQKRLTVLLDPGRIKRGVETNVRLGPALEVGRRYTLVVEETWQDAQGVPLVRSFEKMFRVAAAIRSAPQHESWTLTVPGKGSRQPLALSFDRPLDHALLVRLVTIHDQRGQVVPGSIEVGHEEAVWLFYPQHPWDRGTYGVVAEATLEDLAGNNLRGPLDRAVGEGIRSRNRVTLAFEVRE